MAVALRQLNPIHKRGHKVKVKVSYFNKIPNSLRQVLQTYSEICILLSAAKKSPPEEASKD